MKIFEITNNLFVPLSNEQNKLLKKITSETKMEDLDLREQKIVFDLVKLNVLKYENNAFILKQD